MLSWKQCAQENISEKDEVTEQFNVLYNEAFHDVYKLHNIVRRL